MLVSHCPGRRRLLLRHPGTHTHAWMPLRLMYGVVSVVRVVRVRRREIVKVLKLAAVEFRLRSASRVTVHHALAVLGPSAGGPRQRHHVGTSTTSKDLSRTGRNSSHNVSVPGYPEQYHTNGADCYHGSDLCVAIFAHTSRHDKHTTSNALLGLTLTIFYISITGRANIKELKSNITIYT